METTASLLASSPTILLEFYARTNSSYDSWLADSFSQAGPQGKPWSEEKCKLRAREKCRAEFGFIPEEVRWMLRAVLGGQPPD